MPALEVDDRAPRHDGGRGFAMRVLIAGGLAVALVAGAFIVTHNRIDSVHPKHVVALGSLHAAGAIEAATFLLVGSDTRSTISSTSDLTVAARADTIVLVRVEPSTHRLFAVSLPRDLFVTVPGCGSIKLDATFDSETTCGSARGGVGLLVETITTELDVPVDHVVGIGFPGFRSLVDAVGGLRITFPTPTRDRYTGLDVKAGCQTLTGLQSLSYVRARNVERLDHGVWEKDSLGDIGRIGREQVALHALASAALAGAGTDPRPLLQALFANVTVDSKFTSHDALQLFDALRADRHTATLILPVAAVNNGLALTPGAREVLSIVAGRAELRAGPATRLGASIGATNETANC